MVSLASSISICVLDITLGTKERQLMNEFPYSCFHIEVDTEHVLQFNLHKLPFDLNSKCGRKWKTYFCSTFVAE